VTQMTKEQQAERLEKLADPGVHGQWTSDIESALRAGAAALRALSPVETPPEQWCRECELNTRAEQAEQARDAAIEQAFTVGWHRGRIDYIRHGDCRTNAADAVAAYLKEQP